MGISNILFVNIYIYIMSKSRLGMWQRDRPIASLLRTGIDRRRGVVVEDGLIGHHGLATHYHGK